VERRGNTKVDDVRPCEDFVESFFRSDLPAFGDYLGLFGLNVEDSDIRIGNVSEMAGMNVSHSPRSDDPDSHGKSLLGLSGGAVRHAIFRPMDALPFILIGITAGILGGLFGIGGGVMMVPALIYLKGFSQKKAQGTSLAVFLLPVALLGFLNYYREGEADLAGGAWMAAGVFCGAYLGSRFAMGIDEAILRKLFAGLLLIVAVQLFLKK
jgi:hypothetical protein